MADDASLTTLVATPVTFTLNELEKDEKVPRATATLSLAPLLGASSIAEAWLPLAAADGAEGEMGELLVSVEATGALLTEDQFEESTVLTVGVAGLYALPPSWHLAEGQGEADHLFTYDASIELAGGAAFALSGGAIAPPAAPPAEEAAAEEPAAAEGEGEGEAAAAAPAPAAEVDPEAAAEAAAASVGWASTATVFLGPEAVAALRSAAEGGESTGMKLTLTRVTKSAEATIDQYYFKYKGSAAPDLGELLEVDATSASVKAAVGPTEAPTEEEVAAAEAAEEARRAGGGDAKGKKGAKGPEKVAEEEEGEEGAPHPYEVAGTYLRLTLSTSRPINPRPPTPPPPLPKPSELIPKRILPALAPKSAPVEYEAKVKEVVEAMVGEWSALFPQLDPSAEASAEEKEERRRQLLFHLNQSGQVHIRRRLEPEGAAPHRSLSLSPCSPPPRSPRYSTLCSRKSSSGRWCASRGRRWRGRRGRRPTRLSSNSSTTSSMSR